jgi:hypothetical protein
MHLLVIVANIKCEIFVASNDIHNRDHENRAICFKYSKGWWYAQVSCWDSAIARACRYEGEDKECIYKSFYVNLLKRDRGGGGIT